MAKGSFNKTNRKLHKWLGTIPAIIFLLVAITGILLIFSKELSLSPKTEKGVKAEFNQSLDMQKIIDSALALKNDELKSAKDIRRIEFYPENNMYKVRSKKGFEVQVDMSTGEVLSSGKYASTTISSLHTGYYFGSWFARYVVAASAIALAIASLTGIYLFFLPVIKKRKNKAMQDIKESLS
jgi:uncharacterized iron-regulated membrane protein